MHCDIDQVGSIENIRQALEDIGVDRIDHGTNIVESPPLVEEVKRRGIGLTCCPISNSFVTSDMKATEIVSLLRDGVRVTVNSDDPAYFRGYVTENFAALADAARSPPPTSPASPATRSRSRGCRRRPARPSSPNSTPTPPSTTSSNYGDAPMKLRRMRSINAWRRGAASSAMRSCRRARRSSITSARSSSHSGWARTSGAYWWCPIS